MLPLVLRRKAGAVSVSRAGDGDARCSGEGWIFLLRGSTRKGRRGGWVGEGGEYEGITMRGDGRVS